MSLKKIGEIELPTHIQTGGFDHAAVEQKTGRLYIAHTANNSVEVVDCKNLKWVNTISGFPGVAGTLVSGKDDLIFTSNRAAGTVSVLNTGSDVPLFELQAGVRPNGLAYDSKRKILLVANVGNPEISESRTVSLWSLANKECLAHIPMPSGTRWAIFDESTEHFYVNIREPGKIAVIDAKNPKFVSRWIDVPGIGPHGLDIDSKNQRLFCACDDGNLFAINIPSGEIEFRAQLAGTPDVVFFNVVRSRLYVAIGDPGVIEVYDTNRLEMIDRVETETGAHTFGWDLDRQQIFALVPKSCRALVFQES